MGRDTGYWPGGCSRRIGMSEGVGFVNTALLEEEHDQPLIWPENDGARRPMSATKKPSR
jgi:hypothetical protein